MNKIFSILFVFISVVSFGQRPQELQGWGIKPNRLYQNPANVSNQTDTVNYKVALFNTATGKYDKVAWAYLSSLFTGSTHIAWDSVTSKPNSGSFIYNQNASAQASSNLWVDGRVRGGSLWTESYLWAQRNDPYLILYNTDGAVGTDKHAWGIHSKNIAGDRSQLLFTALADNGTDQLDIMNLYRTGAVSIAGNIFSDEIFRANGKARLDSGLRLPVLDYHSLDTANYQLLVRSKTGEGETAAMAWPTFGGGGTTTNALTVDNSGSGDASGFTFNGSAAKKISYNSIGAQQALTLTTTGTSGAATLSSGTLNIPNYASGMTNPMTTLGDIIYGGTSGTPTRLAGSTISGYKVLGQSGTGSASAAPAWVYVGDLVAGTPSGDFPFHNGTNLAYNSNLRNVSGNISIENGAALRLSERTTPGTPASGYGYVYPKSDGKIYYENSAGTEYDLTATGSGGVTTMAAIGSTPNANGASISGSTLTLQPASASFGGVLTTGSQTIEGSKTFNQNILTNGAVVASGELLTDAYLRTKELAATPTTPSNTYGVFWVKNDGTAHFLNDGGTDIQLGSGGGGMTNPMTTANDIIVGGSSGTPTRLAVGGEGASLTVSGGNVSWATGTAWNGAYSNSSSGDLGGTTFGNTNSTLQIHTGGTGTTTLPLVSGAYSKVLHFVNQGTGTLTIQRQSSDQIFWHGTNVTSFPLAVGQSAVVGLQNSKWVVWFDGYDPNNLTTTTAASTYQPLDADLTAFAAKTAPTGTVVGTSDAQALTNKDLTGAGNTFPTFNQNTTGTASKFTGMTIAEINTALSTYDFPTAVGSAGKVVVSDGTNLIMSTPTFPNASATSGKVIKSDGTNWVASTETYAAPGTSGNIATSDGTNWTSAANNGGWTTVRVSGSDATTTGQSLVDITGLTSGTLSNSTKYEFEAVLDVSVSAVTTGNEYGVGAGGTGGAAVVSAILTGTTTGTSASSEGLSTTAGTASTARLLTSGQSGTIMIKGFVTTRGSGTATISIQHLKVTSGTSTVKVGSVFRYRLAQ